MKIIEPISTGNTSTVFPTFRISGETGHIIENTQELISEHTIELFLNNAYFSEIVCSPTQLPELILGRLLSAGLISGTEDVECIAFTEDASRVRIILEKDAKPLSKPVPFPPVSFAPEWITSLAEALQSRSPLHRRTYGAHGCILMQNGEILQCCEDLGRHNAMEKALGWAFRNHIDPKTSILFTSSRVPRDMVWNTIRAGFPILASKSLPTAQAVELARDYHLTLIGHVHPDGMKIFSH